MSIWIRGHWPADCHSFLDEDQFENVQRNREELKEHVLNAIEGSINDADGDGPAHQPGRRRPGPGLDGLDAQGWPRVMAYTGPLGEASGTLRKVHSRETATTGPTPALISMMTSSATYRWSATLSTATFSTGYWLDVPKSQTSESQVA